MSATKARLSWLAWSVRLQGDRPDSRTSSVLTGHHLHSQSEAISHSQLARRILWTSMLFVHLIVGTSSFVFTCVYAYIFQSSVWFVDVARMLAVSFDPPVAAASAILSGLCTYLHWYYAASIIKSAAQSQVTIKPTGNLHRQTTATRPRWLKKAIYDLLDSVSVRGSKFEAAFLIREVLTISIQSVQCYRVTLVATRPLVRQVAAALLVVNCISTPMVHALQRENSVVRTRLACLLVNAAIDLAVSFLLPLAVIVPKFLLFWRTPGGIELLFDDPIWYTMLHSELSMMLINNWVSCLAQYVPAITLLRTMHDIKNVIRQRQCAQLSIRRLAVSVPYKSRTTRAVKAILLLHGCLVFGVHVYSVASTNASVDITGCQFFLHPWLANKPACAVIMVDCKKTGLTGSALEVEGFIRTIDPAEVFAITFAHCSRFEMPLAVQNMSRLLVLEFYNTTISKWDEDTGLDANSHPIATRVHIIQCRLAQFHHRLPPGLLHDHLPSTLDYLILSDTLLLEFPIDFHNKWPRRMASLQCNKCGLTALPSSFFATQVSYKTSLADNNLTSLPDSFFTAPVPKRINLNNNQISHVPSLINATGLVTLSMQRNLIEELVVTNVPVSLTTVAVGGTPYCGGRSSFQLAKRTNVSCEVVDDALFTFPTAAWVVLRGME